MDTNAESNADTSSDIDQELEVLPEGRYIPYSGGSMSWFENQGVLRCERGNNYRFHTVMESEHVRAALFQRWGQVTDKRAARRVKMENSINLLMSEAPNRPTPFRISGEAGEISGETQDVSHYGMRMQFTKDIPLSKGDAVTVQLLSPEDSSVLLELPAVVVWIKREVVVRPVWFVGVAFSQLTTETEEYFGEFLGSKTPIVR